MNRIRVPVVPRWLRVAAVVLVAAVILAASVRRPTPGPPSVFLGVPLDKWLHLCAYAGFATVLAYALLPVGRPLSFLDLALVVAAAVAFGVGIELLQGTLPYRSMSGADVVANGAGAVVGTLPWWVVAPRQASG